MKSGVLTRKDFGNITLPDKVVSTSHPGRLQTGMPYILTDIYTGTSLGDEHAHIEQSGAISWYEFNNTVFVYSLGYNNRLPEHASHVMITNDTTDYPYREHLFTPGVYQRASLPTVRLSLYSLDVGETYLRTLNWTTVNFRVQNDLNDTVYLYLAHVTLEGDKGVINVEDFSSNETWPNGQRVTDDIVGKYAMKLRCPPKSVSFHSPPRLDNHLNYMFDYRDYSHLRFYWKMSNNSVYPPTNRLVIFSNPSKCKL